MALSVLGGIAVTTAVPADESPGVRSLPERPVLTGNWWGLRDQLESNGVAVEPGLTQFYQGAVTRAGDDDFEYGGKAEEQ